MSYLASEDTFGIVKDLFARNLIVPVVGNFAGPKSIRGIGTYVRSRSATVTAFYLSNVEPILKDAGSLPTFCANVATLPMDPTSVLIKIGNAGTLPQDDPTAFDRPVGQPLRPSGATPMIGTFVTGVVLPMATRCGGFLTRASERE